MKGLARAFPLSMILFLPFTVSQEITVQVPREREKQVERILSTEPETKTVLKDTSAESLLELPPKIRMLNEASQDDDIFNAKSIKCWFDTGHSWRIDQDKLLDMPDIEFGPPVVIDGINLDKRVARMIANAGTGNLRAVSSNAGLTFLEAAGSNGYNMTTVFSDRIKQNGIKYFVGSTTRHVKVLIFPAPQMYIGRCLILELHGS